MNVCVGLRVTAGEVAGPARNSRPGGIYRAVRPAAPSLHAVCQHTNAGPCQGDTGESLDGLLCPEDSATTRRSKSWPLHPPSLFFSFSLGRTGSWSEGSPDPLSSFPFSPANVSPNKIPACLIPSWHPFLGESKLTQGPTVKTY